LEMAWLSHNIPPVRVGGFSADLPSNSPSPLIRGKVDDLLPKYF
jgi:hypothetical protein